jgi:hypothetical protein
MIDSMENLDNEIILFVRKDEDDYIALSWCPTAVFPSEWIRECGALKTEELESISRFVNKEIPAGNVSADEVLDFLESEDFEHSDKFSYRISQFAQLMPEILDQDEEADLVQGETVETSRRLADFLILRQYTTCQIFFYS